MSAPKESPDKPRIQRKKDTEHFNRTDTLTKCFSECCFVFVSLFRFVSILHLYAIDTTPPRCSKEAQPEWHTRGWVHHDTRSVQCTDSFHLSLSPHFLCLRGISPIPFLSCLHSLYVFIFEIAMHSGKVARYIALLFMYTKCSIFDFLSQPFA